MISRYSALIAVMLSPYARAAVFASPDSAECPRHSVARAASPVPWLFVRLHLQPVVEFVETGEQVNNGHQFEYRLVIQSQVPHRGSVHPYSVIAA